MFVAVPRVYEKVEERLKEAAMQAPAFLTPFRNWAKRIGTEVAARRIKF